MLREALGELWLLFGAASAQLQNAFLTISEFPLESRAEAFAVQLRRGRMCWKLHRHRDAIALSVGAQIRAIDAVLAERESFFSNAAEVDPYLIESLDLFVVPSRRIKAKIETRGPTSTFFRRGAPNHRIFSRRIRDSFDVNLLAPTSLQTLPEDDLLRFAGALIDQETHTFVGTDSARLDRVSAPNEIQQLRDGVVSAFAQPLFVAAWPELSMSMARLEELIGETKRQFNQHPLQGPRIIAAGSWHDHIDGTLRNRMRILDRAGNERLIFDKITQYVGRDVAEANEAGDTIPVLLTDAGLVSFAICSDFCVTTPLPPPYIDIDLDFLVVISLGNDVALNGHEQSSRDLGRKFGTRTFVVQQNEDPSEPLGWVLPKPANASNAETNDTWNMREL